MSGVGVGNSKVPRANHPDWFQNTRPLRDFLNIKAGRTWDELIPWGKDNEIADDLLRNMLAWLCIEGWASYSKAARRWFKRALVIEKTEAREGVGSSDQ